MAAALAVSALLIGATPADARAEDPPNVIGLSISDSRTSALAGLLGLDVGDVLVGGWRRHHALVRRLTRPEPIRPPRRWCSSRPTGSPQLTGHMWTSSSTAGRWLRSIFDLGLTVDVDGVLGTVRQARLVAIQGGRCTITAGLGCEGVEIASRQAVIDPTLTVRLGQGIALLDEERKPSIA